jgi:hypothetical protein
VKHRFSRSLRGPLIVALGLCSCQGAIDSGADPGAPGDGTRPGEPAAPGPGRPGGGAPGAAPAPGGGAGAGAAPAGGAPAAPGSLDPGRVTLRRLNRVEYDNTVRDLLGTALRPAERLPGDEVDRGFDTLGSAVSVSPVHVEIFEAAAEDLVDELLALPPADPRRQRVLVCPGADDGCLRQILAGFARRAFRRPVADAEIGRLVALAARVRAQTSRTDDGVRAALVAVLLSPHFLFRVERDPPPGASAPRALSDHELAARLSYFLWSTMPDDELGRIADGGRLTRDGAELDRQLTRMLASPRADALARHFAGQWLFTRAIEQFQPDKAVYRAYDDRLRAAMRAETERFFTALLQEAMPIEVLLQADFSYVNDRLARHYGLPAAGAELQRASLGSTPRRGLLGQGSFLLVTSQPERTSPVKRGAWVLEQILCAPPPPPPPNVEAFTPPRAGDGTTLRQRLERHRQSPECAACHRLIDPIGLGLETFDGIGAHRTTDNGKPVDATGELPDGTRFSGPVELAAALARDPRFATCAAEHMLTYAVGRAFDAPADHAYTAEIARRARAAGGTWPALVRAVALGEAFRLRRGE